MSRENLLAPAATPTPERADAARNRKRVLAAAAKLYAEHGAAQVTMEDIARAAGIGRGTLYRRYPDRAAIAIALLDEHERELQQRILSGPPPLGPGAPPPQRLAAFYRAMVTLLDTHAHLALGTEVGHSRFRTGTYGFWRTHVRELASAAGLPDPDALAEPLLAAIAPEVFVQQRDTLGLDVERIADGLAGLALRALSTSSVQPQVG